MTFYLLIATVKGNFKFGLRIMILGAIHPMKKDKTYMNSILFNVMLVMLTSVSVIQFSIRAFGEYTSLTDADIIFNTQIKYLTFYRFFFNYNIFEYGMLIIALISFVYLICRPNDTNTVKKILFKKFENDKKINQSPIFHKQTYIKIILNRYFFFLLINIINIENKIIIFFHKKIND